MANLLDSIKEHLSPELIGQVASGLGESEGGIAKALGGLAPTILAGILNKSGDSNAMGGIFSALSNFDSGILGNLGSLVGGGNLAHNDPKDIAGQFLGSIFGSKVPAITNAISSFSGVKSSSTSSLLGLVGPLLMGVLSKKINTGGLNVSGLMNMLSGEKSSIMGALPTGLGSVLGLADMGNIGNVKVPEVSSGGNKWLLPLMLLVGLGGGIMYYMKNCTAVKPEVAKVEIPAPAAPVVAKPTVFEETLPGGFKLNGALTGIESQLVGFIKDAARPVDKTTWFNFDHLNFKTGSADLDMDYSKQQLTNIYEVLKAYPSVKLKVGGYTDNVGKEASNMALSAKRATTVVAELVKMGIEKARLEGEGYGSQHPVASNDTEEGRAQNRRIGVRVTAK